MNIITLTTDYMGSHIYLIEDDKHVVVIDPSDLRMITEYVEEHQLCVDMGILTHEHCDHTYNVEKFKTKYQCPVIASEICSERLKDPRTNFSAYYPAMLEICDAAQNENGMRITPFSASAGFTFSEQLTMLWNGHKILLKETPGHTKGSICVLVDDVNLFSGDSLFYDCPANLRFPGGSKRQYKEVTIPWLMSLPYDTHVYPGHYKDFKLCSKMIHTWLGGHHEIPD